MNRLIALVIVAALLFARCNTQEPKSQAATDVPPTSTAPQSIDPKAEFAKLNEFLKKYDEPSQTFNITTDKVIKVKGKQGTNIYINPADLETMDGKPIGKTVDIELKELTNQEQLLKANAQTVSYGVILVSGGACYINVTSGGQTVKLKKGRTYSVEFTKISSAEMSLYYGERDSLGKINWKEAGQKFKTSNPKSDSGKVYTAIVSNDLTHRGKDTSSAATKKKRQDEYEKWEKETVAEQIKSDKYYQPVELDQFDWINCDRVFASKAPKTNITYTIANKPQELNYIEVYMVFKNINSVMSSAYYINDNEIQEDNFNNIPIGESVKFLAVGYQNNKIFANLSDITTIKANLNQQITLQEISEEDFQKLMNSLN